MGRNLRWNIDTGEMEVLRGGEWVQDAKGNDVYIDRVTDKTPGIDTTTMGTYEDYVAEDKSMKDKLKDKYGENIPENMREGYESDPLSKEDWEKANRTNLAPTIRLSKYSDLRFASEEDNAMENDIKAFRSELIAAAWNKNAKPWHIISGAQKDNFMGKIHSYNDAQFRDFYFGGLSYDYSTNRMDETAPAYIKLKEEDRLSNKLNEDGSFKAGYGPGTKDWEGRLTILKEQSFVKGSQYRKDVGENLWKVLEKQYQDTHAEYKRENPEDFSGGTTWNTSFGAVDKNRANEFVNNINSGKTSVRDLQGNDWTKVDGKYTIKGRDGVVSRTPAEMMEKQEMSSYYPDIYKKLYNQKKEKDIDIANTPIGQSGFTLKDYKKVGDEWFFIKGGKKQKIIASTTINQLESIYIPKQ